MGQLIESRFRVLEIDMDDVLLTDIADAGFPVHVSKERSGYSDSLQNAVNELEPGNVIEAEIQSDSISIQDDTWDFVQLTVTEKTRFHFIEDAGKHSSHVEDMMDVIANSNRNLTRQYLTSNGERIGFLTVGVDKGDRFWSGLRSGLNSHEFDLQNLEKIGRPPYEAIYTRTPDKSYMIFYHFRNIGTEVAQAILNANSE